MNEVYVDDFMILAVATAKEQLRHVPAAVMTGIHDIFPPAFLFRSQFPSGKGQEPVCAPERAPWFRVRRGGTHPVARGGKTRGPPAHPQRVDTWGHDWPRRHPIHDLRLGRPKATPRVHGPPQRQGAAPPCNRVCALQPPVVYLHHNKALLEAIHDARTLL
ncbi:hypothetical protein ACHAWF_009437 [Thalassiosira exigua]